jgi:hypothetical protein
MVFVVDEQEGEASQNPNMMNSIRPTFKVALSWPTAFVPSFFSVCALKGRTHGRPVAIPLFL